MTDTNDVFGAGGLSPRAQISEWVNVTGKDVPVGTSVKGKFMSWFFNPAKEAGYGDQIVLVLERESDKKVVAVPVKDKSFLDKNSGKQIHFIKDRVAACLPGDMVGVRYDGDKEMGAGKNDAKIVNIYNPALELREKEGKAVTTAAEAPEAEPQSEADKQFEAMATPNAAEPAPNPADIPF